MATDKKITDLNSIVLSELNTETDSLVIVNTFESKKITPNQLMTNRIESQNSGNGHILKMTKVTQGEYDALVNGSGIVDTTLYVIEI
jgi:hypothetical protein